jgi:hypothetical protein
MKIQFTVIYPKVDRTSYPEPQREFTGLMDFPTTATDKERCDILFAGFGNHPIPFRWFLTQRARSMSVGDVVRFGNDATAYVCDTSGWLHVSIAMAQSWLNFKRQYGCDMFELKQWKRAVGLDK